MNPRRKPIPALGWLDRPPGPHGPSRISGQISGHLLPPGAEQTEPGFVPTYLEECAFYEVRTWLRWVASCLRWKGMIRLKAGREGDRKDEFEPVWASQRILRCPQRGQPPARRDVRWSWPSTGRPENAGYGGVGPLSGRASKGRGPRS